MRSVSLFLVLALALPLGLSEAAPREHSNAARPRLAMFSKPLSACSRLALSNSNFKQIVSRRWNKVAWTLRAVQAYAAWTLLSGPVSSSLEPVSELSLGQEPAPGLSAYLPALATIVVAQIAASAVRTNAFYAAQDAALYREISEETE